MNKDGKVDKYKHHEHSQLKDVSETNHNKQHKKGGHPGEGPDHKSLKDIPHSGSEHHKGNLAAHGQHGDGSGGYHAHEHNPKGSGAIVPAQSTGTSEKDA